jgi:hypothetical protein
MESARAVKFAIGIGIVVAIFWIFRDDHLCRAEISERFGQVGYIEHSFASTNYKFVPPSWKAAWRPGMPYPAAVTCWTDFAGVSRFSKHSTGANHPIDDETRYCRDHSHTRRVTP